MGKFRLVIVTFLCLLLVGCGLRGGQNTLADLEAEYDRAQDAIAHAEQLNAQQYSPRLLELARDRLQQIREKQLSAPSSDVMRQYKYIQMLAQRAVMNALNERVRTVSEELQNRPQTVPVDTEAIQRELDVLEDRLSNQSSSLDSVTRENERQTSQIDELRDRTKLIRRLRSQLRQLRGRLSRVPPTRMGDTLSRLLSTVRRHDRVITELCDNVRSLGHQLTLHRNRIDKEMRGRHSGFVYPRNEPGLVGYWPFEQGEDGRFADRAGNLDLSQTIGSMQQTRGIFGSKGISFSERGSLLGISDHPDLDPGSKEGFSVSGWFHSGRMGGSAYLMNKLDPGEDAGWDLTLSPDGLVFTMKSAARTIRARSSGDYLDGQWHHFAVVYSRSGTNSEIKLYVNGEQKEDARGLTDVETDQYLSIGGAAGAPDQFFTGRLDEIRIYRRALSQGEVLNLAARAEVPVGEACQYEPSEEPEPPRQPQVEAEEFDTGLIAHWPLDKADEKWTPDRKGGAPGRVFGARPGVSGKINGAMSFRDNSHRIRVMDRPLFDRLNSLTITAWVRPEEISRQYIFSKGIPQDGEMASPYALFFTESEDLVFSINTTEGFNQIRKVGYDAGEWIFLAGTYDGSRASFYVNGEKVSTLSVSGTLTGNDLPVFLGSRYGAYGGIKGRLDDVRLYNYALSGTEIKQLPGL